jgi:hypothetical protein
MNDAGHRLRRRLPSGRRWGRRARTLSLVFVAAGALLVGAGSASAQPACTPGPFDGDGFVTIQGGRLALDGQRFRIRGVGFLGGRGVPSFPLVPLTHPDGTVAYEEVFPQSIWAYFDAARIEAELALLKEKLGINAIRVPTLRPPLFPPFGSPEGWFLPDGSLNPLYYEQLQSLLCICRKLGIKVHLALLWNIANYQGGYPPGGYPADFVAFNLAYLDYLIPKLADEPAILAYEIGNENIHWESNQATSGNVAAVKLLRTLIAKVRSLDANHLITSGEVAVPVTLANDPGALWRYPSPEFTPMDLDGTGQLTSLAELVDYVSPHFYSHGVFEVGGQEVDYGPVQPVLEEMKRRTSKPIAMGETNRGMRLDHVLPTDDDAIRETFFKLAETGMRQACRQIGTCAGDPPPGTDGYLAWWAEPALDLRPGTYVRQFHCKEPLPGPGVYCDHPWPYLWFEAEGRGVHIQDAFELLYYPDADPATTLEPLAPGRVFRRSLKGAADFGGDGTTDLALFRPATGEWLVYGRGSVVLGLDGDLPVAADWNGDGRTEPAAFRPVSLDRNQPAAEWWLLGQAEPILFGRYPDVPVPGDYDGDGDSEIAVFRPQADDNPAVAAWHVRGQISNLHYGNGSDVPVPADYDGDGDLDIAVFRPATGQWFVRAVVEGVVLGAAGDLPVPADYDGDGKADFAVFRPATGQWFVAGQIDGLAFGAAGDLPVPADYDGGAEADFAVFRPATGQWFVRGQASGLAFGAAGDLPVVRRPQY